MKWAFTLTALLFFVESTDLYHLINKDKHQVIQVLCDNESDKESTCDIQIEITEIDKTVPDYNSLTPALFQRAITYNNTVAMYLSEYIADMYQPPKLCYSSTV